ncbi:MAG: hypothetical protein V3T39_07160 [Gammaproteobacteria bacterium]
MKSQPVGMAFHQLPATFQSYWESSKGWVISENCDNQMTISTAASLFSYAFGIFEGMKAYKTQQAGQYFDYSITQSVSDNPQVHCKCRKFR